MEKTKRKYSKTDRLILGIGFTLLGLFVLSIAIPIVYVILASFMDPTVLNNQGLSFRFKDWTIDAYRRVLENEMIWRGFINSFLYSLAFTVISVLVTLLVAYPMSKKNFVGRKFFNLIFLFTMFFGGGMIPTFILINQLHLVNTVWAILLPGAFNVWNMILARTYYQSVPTELREASAIDGAGKLSQFFHVTLPGIMPSFWFLLMTRIIGSLQMFDIVYTLTGGGPSRSTTTLVVYIYDTAFKSLGKTGYATAMSEVLFGFIMIITVIMYTIMNKTSDD